jgi:hypothetical protein
LHETYAPKLGPFLADRAGGVNVAISATATSPSEALEPGPALEIAINLREVAAQNFLGDQELGDKAVIASIAWLLLWDFAKRDWIEAGAPAQTQAPVERR